MSRRLIIDSSIARAASGEESVHPVGKQCRDFLQEILRICHRVSFTEPVREEWNRHQSRFAKRWLTAMFARKKVETIPNTENPTLRAKLDELTPEQTENLASISDPASFEKMVAAMRKDLHLIEAALASDQLVASLDETVREFFVQSAATLKQLKNICWVNPTKEEDDVVEWLANGAKSEKSRRLGPSTE
jgi:hypothetical protein